MVDGLADKPIDGKTPLTEAYTPNIDFLAMNGSCGELKLLSNDIYPDSHTANISLLGYNYKKYDINRGPLEAIGSGINYKNEWLALRCNLATVDENLIVVDRRSGRNSLFLDELCRFLNDNVALRTRFSFNHTIGHRAVLIIKSHLSDRITSNDPKKAGVKVRSIQSLDHLSLVSAKIVQDFIENSHELLLDHKLNKERVRKDLLPFNYILVRGAGNKIDHLPDFCKKYKLEKVLCIAENGSVKGTCVLAGFDYMTIPETDYEGSLDFIFNNLDKAVDEYDLVYVHVKNIDEAGHDGDFQRKKEMIEELDKRLKALKKFDGIFILSCDHITSCSDKSHLAGNVPFLIHGKGKDKVRKFDEMSVKKGKFKNYTSNKMWKIIYSV